MMEVPIGFGQLPWTDIAPGAWHKVHERDGWRLRLVEFTDRFVEDDWCMKPHMGYVLEGELIIGFQGARSHYRSGDGLWLAAGRAHKASVPSGMVARLVLFEPL